MPAATSRCLWAEVPQLEQIKQLDQTKALTAGLETFLSQRIELERTTSASMLRLARAPLFEHAPPESAMHGAIKQLREDAYTRGQDQAAFARAVEQQVKQW